MSVAEQQKTRTKPSVMVALSGGVDSAVAALLLKQAGYRVQALFMKNWEDDDSTDHCHAEGDHSDAKAVCEHLHIPLHSVNFSHEYWEQVFSYFLSEYQKGRTPNPDILCNREIKFKVFLEHAQNLGADFMATGHYVRSTERQGKFHLLKGCDNNKDQSYFLYAIEQHALKSSMFPLGDLTKPQVRKLALEAGLQNYAKRDSTGICFIGKRPFREFLSRYLPACPGAILTLDGTRIGSHQGTMYYTLGQRKGLGIGGVAGSSGAPWYVVAKNIKENLLIVAEGFEHAQLYGQTLNVAHVHWISGPPLDAEFTCSAKTRYRQEAAECTLKLIGKCGYHVVFKQPQRAITPGQSVVFYDGERCLGGGIIETDEIQ